MQKCFVAHLRNSPTGTRTRVAWVTAAYSNQLDYSGFCWVEEGATVPQDACILRQHAGTPLVGPVTRCHCRDVLLPSWWYMDLEMPLFLARMLLVVRPGAPSSVLAPSSDAPCSVRSFRPGRGGPIFKFGRRCLVQTVIYRTTLQF